MSSLFTLYPHQIEGAKWMSDFESNHSCGGGCLLDEMGLGKTLTVLSFIFDTLSPCKSKGDTLSPSTTVVVSTRSILHQWQQQIEQYFPQHMHMVHSFDTKAQYGRSPMILLVPFGNDFSEQLKGHNVKRLVIDEAHLIRSYRTMKFRIIVNAIISLGIDYKWMITGTPFNNRIDDLMSLDCILSGDNIDHSFWSGVKRSPTECAIDMMNEWLSKRSIRRTLADTKIKLPSVYKYTHILHQDRNESYTDLYKDDESYILTKIMKLRQSVVYPPLTDKDSTDRGKMPEILETVKKTISKPGEKLVIFSFFIGVLECIKCHYCLLYTSPSPRDRG